MPEKKEEEVSRYRTLTGAYRWWAIAFSYVGVILSVVVLFHLPIAAKIYTNTYFALLLGLFLPQVFLWFPLTKGARRDKVPWYDLLLAVLCMVGPAYICLNAYDISAMGWDVCPPTISLPLAVLTILLLLEGVRRTTGMILAVVVAVFAVYPLFASHMPGFLFAKSYSLSRLIGFHFLGLDSIFGLVMSVFCNILIGFMVFAVVLTASGAGKVFVNFALSLLGHVRGGPAKVSIVSSALMATVSGSAISNVVSTGSFTIPTMKQTGYPSHYAAAIEACSSTGGVLTPPVMGATAFIMAQFLQIPYVTVCIAALIPAVLYYVSLFMQSDFYAVKVGLKGIPREELPSLIQTLKGGWPVLCALVALIYFLVYQRLESQAPYYAVGVLLVVAMMAKMTRLSGHSFVEMGEGTGKLLSELVAILASIGMIIGALSLTGIAQGLSSSIVSLAGGSMLLLLIMGALASFILGMGMSITACYVFLAILLAPALVSMGIYPLAAHLFIMYWGMVSFITPPVAIAAYAAAGMAGANPLRTGLQSLRLGIVALIIPFFFCYNPALVAHGSGWEIFTSILTAGVGIALLASAIEGYMFKLGVIRWVTRAMFLITGGLLLFPGWQTDLIALAFLAVGFIIGRLIARRKPTVPEDT